MVQDRASKVMGYDGLTFVQFSGSGPSVMDVIKSSGCGFVINFISVSSIVLVISPVSF